MKDPGKEVVLGKHLDNNGYGISTLPNVNNTVDSRH